MQHMATLMYGSYKQELINNYASQWNTARDVAGYRTPHPGGRGGRNLHTDLGVSLHLSG